MPNRLVADPMLDKLSTVMVVTRPFSGAGRSRFRGELVETAGWRNVPSLVEGRYLAILPNMAGDPADIEIDGETRRFLDEEQAIAALARLEAMRTPPAVFEGVGGAIPADANGSAAQSQSEALEDSPETVLPKRESPKGAKR